VASLDLVLPNSPRTAARSSFSDAPWSGLAMFVVDGTTMRVPDADENRLHFGGQARRVVKK
jgi:hypothetical protein